jgi:hypothetical protein
MRPTRNNYRQSTETVKSHFALCVQKLFTAERHGYKITNKTIIAILTAALCYCESNLRRLSIPCRLSDR